MAGSETRFSFIEVLDILGSSPRRLATAATGCSDDILHAPLEPGGWSARDILGHLRACQRTWSGYIERILDEDHPAFRYVSPRSTIRGTDFLTVPFRDSLAGFAADRAVLVARLHAVGSNELSRVATVKLSGGRIEEHTAFSYAHRMAEHEREHVEHVERALASGR
ncbi:MAG TPA: DinB family protein [Candidatus Limnocylindrales bacterium]|nr:DinB family protein [Candidatus Limnocylindrales bacterium]